MSSDPKGDLVRNWWAKSAESLLSARILFDSDSLASAINRLYYAAFYAVTAALLDRGRSFKRHSGVKSAFHIEFIAGGILDERWGRFYDQIFEDRQEGDYAAIATFSREYVESKLEDCHGFVKALRPHVSSLQNGRA